jgi:V8-like Glu-specific endopeptidase
MTAALPQNSQGALFHDGSSDQAARDLAAQYQGNLLSIDVVYGGGELHASAVRINDQWALTAAHNLYSVAYPNNYSITVGNGLNFNSSPGEVRSCSLDYLMFPGYNGTSQTPDLALVRLDSPLLGPSLTLGMAGTGDIIYSAGFGRNGTPSSGLAPLDGNARAFESYAETSVFANVHPDEWYNQCAFSLDSGLSLNGRVAPGDSGGPVFNQSGQLVGINIAYIGGNNTPSGTSYYMDLSNPTVRSWIEQNAVVPEPSSLALTGLGALSLYAFSRKKDE